MLTHKNNSQLGNHLAGLADELENCIAPAEAALCIPPKCYTSEDHYAHEINLIFRRKWIGIGHAGRFKEAGDYEAMEIGGVPINVNYRYLDEESEACEYSEEAPAEPEEAAA